MAGRPVRPLCNLFLQGSCRYGNQCRFRHELPAQHESPGPKMERSWALNQVNKRGTRKWNFRLVSYNILADNLAVEHTRQLYPRVPSWCLKWKHRSELIIKELQHYGPDVVCLQEVDHYEELETHLRRLGYQGRYVKRTGERLDGCATFWRTSRLREVEHCIIHHSEYGLKDNVALVVVLEATQQVLASASGDTTSSSGWASGASSDSDSASHLAQPHHLTKPSPLGIRAGSSSLPDDAGPPSVQRPTKRKRAQAPTAGAAIEPPPSPLLMVGNTHVLFNTKRGDIKLGQLRVLLDKMSRMKSALAPREVLSLLGGDFNSTPDSAIYAFMTSGQLDCAQHSRRELSGQQEGWASPPTFRSREYRQPYPPQWSFDARSPAAAQHAVQQALGMRPGSTTPGRGGAGGVSQVQYTDYRSSTVVQEAGGQVVSSFHEQVLHVEGQPQGPSGQMHWQVEASSTVAAVAPSTSGGHSTGAAPMVDPQRQWPQWRSRLHGLGWGDEELCNVLGPHHPSHNPRDEPVLEAVARHNFQLRSSYLEGLGQEPAFTSCHAAATDTVDFVWFTPQEGGSTMDVAAVLRTPPVHTFPTGMPTASWPSDHVALVVDYIVSQP